MNRVTMRNQVLCWFLLASICFATPLYSEEIVVGDTTSHSSVVSNPNNNPEKNKWRFGIRMGAVASDMLYTSQSYNFYTHLPYARGTIGLWCERDIIAGFSIRPELSFTGSGVRLRADDIQYGLFARTFDIRAGLLYTFLRDKQIQPYVLLSPSLNCVMNGRVLYRDGSGQYVERNLSKGTIRPVNFSMMFGGGVRFPIRANGFDFFVNAEMGYNIGCVNTFSKWEMNKNVNSWNGVYSNVDGKRLSSTFEVALTVGIPFSSIIPDKNADGESWIEQRARERRERRAAQEAQERLQAELLRKLQEQQAATNSYNEDLAKYNENLAPQNRVGDGIKMYVVPNVALETADDGTQEVNLKLEFAYETMLEKSISYNKNTDDYPAGAYLPTQSKACKATLGFMKEQLDGELKKYFTPNTRVTIRITGETDGSAIKGKIPYKGEFGDFEQELIYLNGAIDEMTVTSKSGITQNSQLGFLRTQGVRKFIETYIDALQKTQNTYQIYAVEREEKGSQYRKISVELTIHNAYANELQQMQAEQVQTANGADANAAPQTMAEQQPKEKQPSDVDTNIPVTNRNNEYTYVLIVGNEHYKDIVGVVPFAENDAKIFSQYCMSTLGIPQRQIRMVVDATRNEINDGLDWLENIANARQGKANILFYYAGHGVPIKEMTYLLPVDANPEKADQQLPLNAIYERLSDMPAAKVTCIFDACFSGTRRNGQPIVQGGRGVAVKPKFTSIHGNLVIFSAAMADQTAYPFPEQQHGLFTYWLLKALQENKGNIGYKKLIEYLTERVALEASIVNRTQVPNLQFSESLGETWADWTFLQ